MPRIRTPIEAQVAAETLGIAGLSLRRALDTLHQHDANVNARRRPIDHKARADLVAQAGEAFWKFVVQRDLLGLRDPEYVAQEYQVPAEVWQSMGPKQEA